MQPYALRTSKLKPLRAVITAVEDSLCVPVVIVVCGAFNPIHNAHLSLYNTAEAALSSPSSRDAITGRPYLVLGGYLSPVGDLYGKPGLMPFSQRVDIAEAAVRDHPAIEVDCWEGLQPTYARTYYVLEHLQESVQTWYDSLREEGQHSLSERDVSVRVVLACGTDLFRSFFKPGCWRLDLLQKLLDRFYVVVITRPGNNFDCVKNRSDAFSPNIMVSEDESVNGEEAVAGGIHQMLPENCVLTQVINEETYEVDFSKYRFIYKQPTSISSTSSTAIRKALGAAAEAANRHDLAAEKEAQEGIANMVPEAARDLIIKYYFFHATNSEK
ncbi:unnamed protein product [Phytomonas sp. Hart1]|nr:unnamed protein product [Phytomonas sp. Hart1]|eukprot:CCW69676.1 unnamed protein product [Phytomonas sp. isolate Hart1]